MNLLPKSNQEFSKADYWNTFFKKRGKKTFEWYGEFLELSSYLFKYVKPKDDILIVGCGNSTLGMNLYDSGYKNITNIDVSEVVIEQMQETNKITRPDLIFERMDATNMSYEDEKFSVVLDKGTLDALMPNNDKTSELHINKYFEKVKRLLRNSGRYICISLLQEHILRNLLTNFTSTFAVRVIRCHEVETKAKEQNESCIPIFIVVLTKFVKLPKPILEIQSTDSAHPLRLSNIEEVIESVVSSQESASVWNRLCKTRINDEEYVELHKLGENEPRYCIFVLDQLMVKKNKSYAVFIVPQGREMEWLFSTKEGRQQLLKSAQYDRLAIVILQRKQNFESLEAVKNELSDYVKFYAPFDLSNTQIPFISVGSDIGNRKILYEGKSDFSGAFVVEEIEIESSVFRRLIFLNSQFVVQSEAKLKEVTSRRKKTKYIVDPDHLSFDYHLYMLLGLKTVLKNTKLGECVVVGLGGGGLCNFVRRYIPQAKVVCVEIDNAILKVAREYFDLVETDNLKVKIDDGIEFLKCTALRGKKFDAILYDVDGKDTTVGMSCPPKQFVESDFLKTVYNCLTNEGSLIVNIVARNEKLRDEVVGDLKRIFRFVASCKIESDVNEIVFCYKNEKDFELWKKEIQESAKELSERAKIKNSSSEEILKLPSLFSNLKIES